MSYVLLILLFKITFPYNKEAKNAIFFNFSFVLLNENVFKELDVIAFIVPEIKLVIN